MASTIGGMSTTSQSCETGQLIVSCAGLEAEPPIVWFKTENSSRFSRAFARRMHAASASARGSAVCL